MRYVAGIDGGQSGTTAVVVSQDGVVRGRGKAGPADHVDEAPGSTRCADAIATAISDALGAASLAPETTFESVVAGISGYDDHFDGAPPRLHAQRTRLLHDAPIALAGAVQTRPAVVVIAGTGSVAYAEDVSRTITVGGWGYLFDDAGSAYAVARDALASAMKADDRGKRSPLGEAALAFFDSPDLRALRTAALLGRISRSELASFARVVHDAARLGDSDAAAIIARAADALAELAATAIARLDLSDRVLRVAFVGGALSNDAFRTFVHERLASLAPDAIPVTPRYDPAIGAALVAFADAGLPVPERITE
jgi:glucosamine kinase